MPVAKKTTTKTAAKKTSTAKKTATSKTAAKKTTTAKKTTKTAAKTTTKTVTELSVNGNKKIATLQKEFNKSFPYLRLGLYYSYMR